MDGFHCGIGHSTVVRKEIPEPRSRLKPNAVRKYMLYIDSIYPVVYIILYIIREKVGEKKSVMRVRLYNNTYLVMSAVRPIPLMLFTTLIIIN